MAVLPQVRNKLQSPAFGVFCGFKSGCSALQCCCSKAYFEQADSMPSRAGRSLTVRTATCCPPVYGRGRRVPSWWVYWFLVRHFQKLNAKKNKVTAMKIQVRCRRMGSRSWNHWEHRRTEYESGAGAQSAASAIFQRSNTCRKRWACQYWADLSIRHSSVLDALDLCSLQFTIRVVILGSFDVQQNAPRTNAMRTMPRLCCVSCSRPQR